MDAIELQRLALLSCRHDSDPKAKWRVSLPFTEGFPLATAIRPEALSLVYFELEPGAYLGTHRDSAEEAVLVLEGTVEVTLGDESRRAETGAVAIIPAMEPHGVRNLGQTTARLIGFFASPAVQNTFEEPLIRG